MFFDIDDQARTGLTTEIKKVFLKKRGQNN